jgi:glycosyltransferase involved in cell wall biosynthesis
MSQKQKVLIIENSAYITGGFRAIFALTEALKNEIEFHYIIPKGSKVRPILDAHQYPVTELAMLEISKRWKTLLYLPVLHKNANSVLRYMDANGITTLHVNDIFNQLGCAVKRRRRTCKLIYHVRLLKNSYIAAFYPLFAKMIARYADKIVCVSEAVYSDINKDKKAVVLYDRPPITERQPVWEGLQNPQQARILYLANYIPGKGQQLALAVLKDIAADFPGVSMHFYGDVQGGISESYMQALKDYVAAHGLDNQVVFNGKTGDVEATMKAHDLVLNMSQSESFSFVCLEAMLYGVPLVTTNSGGPAEITDYGKMALLTANNDVPGTAAAVRQMLTHAGQYIQLGKTAKDWAAKRFDFDTTLNAMRNIYSETSNH